MGRRLTWQTVRSRSDLTFLTLYTVLSDGRHAATHDTAESVRALDTLFLLQPSIMEWIDSRKVALVDYELMHRRGLVNPVTDLGGDRGRIGELLQASLSHEAMVGCHLSVDTLLRVGMTPEIMGLFHFSLEQWMRLGLERRHIDAMTAAQVEGVFRLTKNVLEASLR